MLRQGTCDQPGCGRSGRVIAKSLPTSGLWCDQCNAKRLTNGRSQNSFKNGLLPGIRANKRTGANRVTIPSVKDLVKKLDDLYSKWVRRTSADDQGYCTCVTCNAPVLWQHITLGHCFPRGGWAIRWDLRNTGPQCGTCNGTVDGEREKFKAYIENKYGEGTVEELDQLRNKPHKLDPIELKKLIKQYS